MAKIKKVFEKFDWRAVGPRPIIGVDEVGRGCLAGPVVAAAVILSPEVEAEALARFRDSKTMSEKRREELIAIIQDRFQWAVGFASEAEIDELNILQASLLAMKRAVDGLAVTSGHVLVDGNFAIPDLAGFVQTPLIKGDSRAEPVAAASIVAKVTRDRFMKDLARTYPEYGFEVHKGYPTSPHRRALAKLGPSAVHRRSFRLLSPDQGL